MRADHAQISRLLKTARGQIDGILRMIEEDRYCMEISTQINASAAILKTANRAVLKAHIAGCMQEAFNSGSEKERGKKIEELLSLVDRTAD